MISSRRAFPALLLLLLTAGAPALCWSPETRVHMADKAVQLMPASLRAALERYREPLLRGLLEPQLDEDAPAHRPGWLEGSLDDEIAVRAEALVATVERAAPFDEIAKSFGALAHFVMDAGFAPGLTADGGGRYDHFAGFCESRREKFPLVFYGHDDPRLAERDYAGFARAVLEQMRYEDEKLAAAYAAAGEPPSAAYFDDRSVPFAVASLSYSRTVTWVARIWLTAWEQAYGDTGRTPYLERN